MGPRPDGRGKRLSPPPSSLYAGLQWGRGRMAAESDRRDGKSTMRRCFSCPPIADRLLNHLRGCHPLSGCAGRHACRRSPCRPSPRGFPPGTAALRAAMRGGRRPVRPCGRRVSPSRSFFWAALLWPCGRPRRKPPFVRCPGARPDACAPIALPARRAAPHAARQGAAWQGPRKAAKMPRECSRGPLQPVAATATRHRGDIPADLSSSHLYVCLWAGSACRLARPPGRVAQNRRLARPSPRAGLSPRRRRSGSRGRARPRSTPPCPTRSPRQTS